MLTPIVCKTCGLPIGDVADIYRHMRAERVAAALKKLGTTETQAAADPAFDVATGDILDELDITELCCRTTLMTTVIFTDFY